MLSYNLYDILAGVRHELNEHSSAYLQGTDTTGKYQNEYLVSKINEAYRELYGMLITRIPGHFFATTTLTGVSSVYTLPGDLGVLSEVRDSNGFKIIPILPGNIRPTDSLGRDDEYVRAGNTIIVNKAGETDPITIYYRKKCRDLIFGQATAGAAGSITLATTAGKTLSQYVGQQIENITKDWVDTITAYTTSRVATVTQTAAASDWYGTVPEIPEAFHHLIRSRAVLLIKASYPIAQERPTPSEMQNWMAQVGSTMAGYAEEFADVSPEEAFE